ncbi:MAG: hypothetical protein Q9195_000072 [Heterodermia aff. obscurata]
MNNTQFRRLVLDTPGPASGRNGDLAEKTTRGGITPALGSRMRSSIPMTPRSIAGSAGNDFARQLAERNASLDPSGTKKFRSTAAPKGTKLGSGYQDRTKMLTSDEEDDKARRIKALEEMVKLGQMGSSTFEALRDEIVGGDISNVHLVKGLDRKLLERVRRGEDVLSGASKSAAEESNPGQAGAPPDTVDVDEELEEMENKEIQPIAKQEKSKQGEMAPAQLAGKKRNRDDILKELRASRVAAAESIKQAAPPSLGPKFTKVGQNRETSRIERDERGREVLITVDENGRVKRKIKKAAVNDDVPRGHGLLMPDKDAQPLGMEVVVPAPPQEEEEIDGDIFEGIGADYDPLDGLDDDEDDSEDEKMKKLESPGQVALGAADVKDSVSPSLDRSSMPPPPLPDKAFGDRRNYFGDVGEKKDVDSEAPQNTLTDPTILAALKKASTLNPLSEHGSTAEGEEEAAKLTRRRKKLEAHDRDAEDMDLGFGSSRFGDEEEAEGKKVKLSVWGKEDGKEGRSSEGKGPRKRGPKKRKGDANSATDVLKVMERRRAEGK